MIMMISHYYLSHDKITSVTLYCLSVCKHSYGRNFDLILMKFCTVIRGPKSKIKFVWDKNLITPSLILGTSNRYNSVPVKDNCPLFAPTHLFSGPDYPKVSFKFLPCRTLLPRQRILRKNWLTRYPQKITAPHFTYPPYTQMLGYTVWQWDRYPILVYVKNS